MQIKLLVSRAGIDFSQNIGQILDLPNDEAIRLIEAGQAEPVKEQEPEKATAFKKAPKE